MRRRRPRRSRQWLICLVLRHQWGRWHFAPLNRYGTTHARWCDRCGERQIAKRSAHGLIYWAPARIREGALSPLKTPTTPPVPTKLVPINPPEDPE
jgi:hypothetical protein